MKLLSIFSFLSLISISFCRKWAFQEKFDYSPSSPSQSLLPMNRFDFVVTHRTHPKEHFTKKFDTFLADHNSSCAGPNPAKSPLPQHEVQTSHNGRGYNPDPAFYICASHLMSAMGDVSGYSVATFYPKLVWDFSAGGKLQFEVNNNARRKRHWLEIVISPREETTVAAGPGSAPIAETYGRNRIVFRFSQGERYMQVGTGAEDPEGIIKEARERWALENKYPKDPSLTDRRIRVRHNIKFSKKLNKIVWMIRTPNNTWDKVNIKFPKLPFTQGTVVFKTHAYTPRKDGNLNDYTDHWDNIRLSGKLATTYQNFEATENVYLQNNGDRSVGETVVNSIKIDKVGKNPILFGQVHNPVMGEVLVSINNGSFFEIRPYSYSDDCGADGWKTFQTNLDPSILKVGDNSFTWKIGERKCPKNTSTWLWIGFSIKSLEVQFDI